jgi:hypothetical protein
VEDTFNLIGHAMEVVVDCAAVVAGMEAGEIRQQAGTELLGQKSIKAALDIDWDDETEQQNALHRLLDDVARLRAWVQSHLSSEAKDPPLKEALDLLERVVEQDIEPDPESGGHRIREGTAKDRRISIVDGEMRHGRKSKSRVINGFKRHVATHLDTGLLLAATVRPANEKEYLAENDIRPDVERLGRVVELHIDRGYLAGNWARQLQCDGLLVLSKPWSTKSERFTKADFNFDFESGVATCPAGATTPIRRTTPDQPERATFPVDVCRGCDLREKCL